MTIEDDRFRYPGSPYENDEIIAFFLHAPGAIYESQIGIVYTELDYVLYIPETLFMKSFNNLGCFYFGELSKIDIYTDQSFTNLNAQN